MVGPISSERRSAVVLRMKVGFVLLVGASGGLITLQGDPTPLVIGGAVLAGLAVGVVLVWLVFPGTGETTSQRRSGRS